MTDFLIWQEGWLINIEPLDNDHREMIRLLNLLADSKTNIETGNDPQLQELKPASSLEHFIRRYDDLIIHIREHFEREETFMESIDYPRTAIHKREHSVQVAAFSAFRRQLSDRGMEVFEQEDLNWIKIWFLDHVVSEDKEYADYYWHQLSH